MILLITFGVFLAVFSLCLLVALYSGADKYKMRKRFDQFVEDHLEGALVQDKPKVTIDRDAPLRNWLRGLAAYFDSPQWTRFFEHKLIQAGLPLRSSEYAVILLGSVVLFTILAFFLSGESMLMAGLGGGIGYSIPILFLRMKIQQRAKKFNNQLGDTLVLIANSLRTGYSFMQAVDMVSREMPPPISLEFARTLKEINLGIAAEEALNNMAKRVDSEDLDLVVTVVLIQRQVGGNLAEVLDNIAGTIRERVKIRGQIKTLTAQGRISGVVIGGLPFVLAMLIYAINPEYMRLLFSTPLGKYMLGGALLSQICGALVIRKIINIDI
jgi:tight adherence protein B